MKVKEVMTKKVISVNPNTKIVEVAQLFIKNRIHGVPVVEGNAVVGIITETDFFVKDKDLSNIYLPSYIDFLKKTKFSSKVSFGNKRVINKLLKAKAKDIMTSDCFVVSPELDIKELLKIIIAKGYFTIPVVDQDKKLVGVITQADIISLIKL